MAGRVLDKGDRFECYDKSRDQRGSSRSALTVANERLYHFNDGATIPGGLVLTNTTPVAAATYGLGLGGRAVLTSDDVAATGVTLNTFLLWEADRGTKASEGPSIVAEFKVSFNNTATREFWFGLTDASGVNDPIALSATSTFTTSTPADYALIGYSATPTSGAAFTTGGNNHVAVSGNAGTDAVVATGKGAVAASTFYTYRVEIDYRGTASFFVNGSFLGYKPQAVRVTIPLCAVAVAVPRTTAGSAEAVVTVDYLYIGGI